MFYLYRPVQWERDIDWRSIQWFGVRPWFYKRFNMDWHNWWDYAWAFPWEKWVSAYVAHTGIVQSIVYDNSWYWIHVRVMHEYQWEKYTTIYAHLESVQPWLKVWDSLSHKQRIGTIGTTWLSSGIHLHFWLRLHNDDWTVRDYKNGYLWWINPAPYIVEWDYNEEGSLDDKLVQALIDEGVWNWETSGTVERRNILLLAKALHNRWLLTI